MSTLDFTPDETDAPAPSGELVHWMGRGPLRVGPSDISATTAGAFLLGVVAAVGLFAAYRWIAPRREGLPPWRWRRGRLH